jgi:hypothetical protein
MVAQMPDFIKEKSTRRKIWRAGGGPRFPKGSLLPFPGGSGRRVELN